MFLDKIYFYFYRLTNHQSENKVDYDLRFHQIASFKENSEYNITIKKTGH